MIFFDYPGSLRAGELTITLRNPGQAQNNYLDGGRKY